MNQHSLSVLEFGRIRELLVERATSAGGARRISRLAPLNEVEEILRRQDAASEIRRILEDSELPIHGLPDLSGSLRAAEPEGATLPAIEIAPVAKALHVTQRLVAFLHPRRESLPHLCGLASGLDPLGPLRGEIEHKIDPSGEVRENATPVLREIRRDQERVREKILDALRRIVRALTAGGPEPVITLRNGRFVVGIQRDRRGDLRGVVHGQSGSGASVYLEPTQVVSANNELAELRSAEEEEIRRILMELTAAIRWQLPSLVRNTEILAEMDAFYAAGRLSRDLGAVPAMPSEDGGVVIRKGRHPLLELANRSAGQVTVPLDLLLGGKLPRTLVITGPNTGGKTVALKTVGLFVLMNQAGLHVPAAEGTVLPIFQEVFADIGDEQSIEASLSTFSSHMSQIVEVLRNADSHSLVLLDELGVGTDPEEGASLGRAILAELTRVSALTVVTTHYGALKVFAHEQPDMENASLEFDRDSLSPTYRFLQGVPGSSEALAIAKRLGFPEHLIEDARSSLGDEREAVEELLHDLQMRRQELLALKAELDEERDRARELQDRATRKLEGLREERIRIKREALEEGRRLVERSKTELSELLGAVSAGGAATQAVGRARTRLGEMGNAFERGIKDAQAEPRPARVADPGEITEGTSVFIPKMGWVGTALSKPGENGKVPVAVGALRVEVPVSALELREAPRERATGRPALVKRTQTEVKTEIDLRGRTVEEALSEVDRALEDLIVNGAGRLRIIHGKGTGALRVAIGEHLTNHDHVQSFRLGEPGEGGTGVTIAQLR